MNSFKKTIDKNAKKGVVAKNHRREVIPEVLKELYQDARETVQMDFPLDAWNHILKVNKDFLNVIQFLLNGLPSIESKGENLGELYWTEERVACLQRYMGGATDAQDIVFKYFEYVSKGEGKLGQWVIKGSKQEESNQWLYGEPATDNQP